MTNLLKNNTNIYLLVQQLKPSDEVSEDTIQLAINFFNGIYKWLKFKHKIQTPVIGYCVDGSIDFVWGHPSEKYLVFNISTERSSYYGNHEDGEIIWPNQKATPFSLIGALITLQLIEV